MCVNVHISKKTWFYIEVYLKTTLKLAAAVWLFLLWLQNVKFMSKEIVIRIKNQLLYRL